MRVTWEAGPLDGCKAEIPNPTILWSGPDLSEPTKKVIVYKLLSSGVYLYDQDLTNEANRHLAEQQE